MPGLQATTNAPYVTDRWTLLSQVEGVETDLYKDTAGAAAGIPTIGLGFSLFAGQTNFDAILKGLGFPIGDPTGDTSYRQLPDYVKYVQLMMLPAVNRAALQRDASGKISATVYNALVSELDAAMLAWAGTDPTRSHTFSYRTSADVETTFKIIIPSYERTLNLWLGKHGGVGEIGGADNGTVAYSAAQGSYERLALLSLTYNNSSKLLGNGLGAALNNGDRAEAWYQIRYASNGDKRQAGRRYYESQVFGLETPNLTGDDRINEDINIFATLGAHAPKIDQYDKDYEASVSKFSVGSVRETPKKTSDETKEALGRLTHEFVDPAKSLAQAITARLGNDPAHEGLKYLSALTQLNIQDAFGGKVAVTKEGVSASGVDRSGKDVVEKNDLMLGALPVAGPKGDVRTDFSDSLSGGKGDDFFVAGAGKDAFSGGDGVDTLSYVRSTEGVSASLGGIGSGGFAEGDATTGIEILIGSKLNDTLSGGAGVLIGGDGNDQLTGTGNVVMLGGAGSDRIVVGGAGAIVDGGAGNDTIVLPASGVGIIVVRDGNDTLLGGAPEKIVFQGLSSADVQLAWDWKRQHEINDAVPEVWWYREMVGNAAFVTSNGASLYIGNLFAKERRPQPVTSLDNEAVLDTHLKFMNGWASVKLSFDDGEFTMADFIPRRDVRIIKESVSTFKTDEQSADAGASGVVGDPGALGPSNNDPAPNPTPSPDPAPRQPRPFDQAFNDLFGGNTEFDPLVLDLSGDGLDLLPGQDNGVYFGWSDFSSAQSTSWIGPGAALLTVDENSDGQVQASELFGGFGVNGFDELATYDSNSDLKIDAADEVFSSLRLWQDLNFNGQLDANESMSLADAGVVSVDLNWEAMEGDKADSLIDGVSTVDLGEGRTTTVASVTFSYNPSLTIYGGDATISDVAASLPELEGYGSLPSLRVAMTQDQTLLTLVVDLALVDPSDSAAFDAGLTAVLYRWAGVTDVDPESRGAFDARKQGVIEALAGRETWDPDIVDAGAFAQAWQRIFSASKARILIQGADPDLSAAFALTAGDLVTPIADFAAAMSSLISAAPSDPDEAISFWLRALPVVSAAVASSSDDLELSAAAILDALDGNIPVQISASIVDAAAHGLLVGIGVTDSVATLPGAEIVGTDGPDVFDVLESDAHIVSRGGGDQIFIGAGMGAVTIDVDGGGADDILSFRPGIAPIDVSAVAKNDSIVLSIAGSDDEVTLNDEFGEGGVDYVQFSDGTSWSREYLLSAPAEPPTVDADVLRGTTSGETIDGLGGDDKVIGLGGGDTFVFELGYGSLKIVEVDSSGTPANTLQFGAGIAPTDLEAFFGADYGLYIGITGTDDFISIDQMMRGDEYGVQSVEFDGGPTWTRQDLIDAATSATVAPNLLYGTPGADVFDGLGGGDSIVGHGGGDTFVFESGYGYLEIVEIDEGLTPSNVLQLGAGIAAIDVKVGRHDDDLYISVVGTSDEIYFKDMFVGDAYGVQSVEFDGGPTWTRQDLIDAATTPSADFDELHGTTSGEILDGLGGDDRIFGNGGGDTIVFELGYGQMDITEVDEGPTPANVLQFGAGITPDNIVVARYENDLFITINETDSVYLNKMFDGDGVGVQSVEFDGGPTWTRQDLIDAIPVGSKIIGTGGDDSLEGFLYAENGQLWNEYYDGFGGNDVATGYGGPDTFYFGSGYGTLEIVEEDIFSIAQSTLKFGPGISSGDVTVSSDENGNIIFDIGSGGDQVVVRAMLLESRNGISAVHFDSSELWSRDDIVSRSIAATSGSDDLRGSSDGETIDGLGGADAVKGSGGDDVFVYESGYGALEIDEFDPRLTSATLQLGSGLTAGSMAVSASEDGDVTLDFGGGDTVAIAGMLADAKHGVTSVTFADGQVLTKEDIAARAATGTIGADTLVGYIGNETFDGLGGGDVAIGNGGWDRFVFELGYGDLEIKEQNRPGANATLVFGEGIDPDDILISVNETDDVVLSVAGTTDQVVLDGMNAGQQWGVQRVEFDNGTVWNRSAYGSPLNISMVRGTSGSDNVVVTEQHVLFDGLGGDDDVTGLGGGDAFVFNAGYGQLTINEFDEFSSTFTNTLQLGQGITAGDVTVTVDDLDIRLTIGVGGDVVVLSNQLQAFDNAFDPHYGLQFIKFSDGTTWDRADLVAALAPIMITGTSASETLFGGPTADIVDGLAGNDQIYDIGGGDTIIYNSTYGHLSIDEEDHGESPNNVLAFGAGITPSGVVVSASNPDDVRITVGSSSHTVTLSSMLRSNAYGVQQITFAGGPTWTRDDIFAMLTTGTSATETLYGSINAEVVDGGGGGDTISARGGGDQIIFEPGYGAMLVTESDFGAVPNNALILTGGILTTDVVVSTNDDDVILNIGGGSDAIVLDKMLLSNNWGVQSIVFDDTTVWSRAQILALAATGTIGNDEIFGTSEAESFDGLGGNDRIVGRGGGDTFSFGLGDGQLEIDETESGSAQNILELGAGITPTDVTLSTNGDGDVILTIGVGGDEITLDGAERSPSRGVQSIAFDGGPTWTRDDFLVARTASTAGDDTLFGTAGVDMFDGQGGDDLVVGNGGGDTFVFESGYGDLTIEELDDGVAPANQIQLGTGISTTDVKAVGNSDGDITLTIGVGGDRIILTDMLDGPAHGVQSIAFDGGPTWDREDIILRATTGTSGNDALWGSPGAETFDGGTGDDYAFGLGGGDTFVYNLGYDNLVINEYELPSSEAVNVLAFGAGIDPGDVVIAGTDGNVVLMISNSFDHSVEFKTSGIGKVTFDDGTFWTAAYIEARQNGGVVLGTSGDDLGEDAISDDEEPSYVDGLGGEDLAIGGGGGDTFIFRPGYGVLEVSEQQLSVREINTLELNGDIAPGDVAVSSDALGNVVLDIGSSGDQVVLDQEQLPGFGVQRVVFSDGTIWGREDLLAASTTGTEGSDLLFGTVDGEEFDGLGGGDIVAGNGGGDTFHFEVGYGALTIAERDEGETPANVLEFGEGIAPADISVSARLGGDVLLMIHGGSDVVTLTGMLNSTDSGVQSVAFDDSTTWSRSDILTRLGTGPLVGRASRADLLLGTPDADVLDGRGGIDVLVGNGGGDTFVFNAGYGVLEISEIDEAATPANVLLLGAGIETSDVVVRGTAAGDIELIIGSEGDIVVLDEMLSDVSRGVQSVAFNGGPTWTRQDVIEAAATGSVGNDALFGTPAADVFDGFGGEDVASGSGGGDTFVFNLGYGSLEVIERDFGISPDNTLAFGAGIDATDVTVSADEDGDVLLSISGGDTVILADMLVGENYGVQSIAFDGGPTWTRQDVIDAAATGTVGANTLFGTPESEVFDGLGGDDVIVGGGGDDTIVFNSGYGSLEIVEHDFGVAPANTLQLGSGIMTSDVVAAAVNANDLQLTIGTGGDVVTLLGMLGDENNGVQLITFDGGPTWDRDDVFALLTTGTTGDDILFGRDGDEVLDGLGGNDLAIGGGGGDTFVFESGYGVLKIEEFDAAASPNNVLALGVGIAPGDVTLTTNADGDIALEIGVGGDEVVLKGANYSAVNGVQSVTFTGGPTWTREDLLVALTTASAGDDRLYGTASNEVFDGLGGWDSVAGNGGGDTFTFNTGYGHLEIFEVDDGVTPANALELGAGITTSDVSVAGTADGDIKLDLGNGDEIVLFGMLRSGANGVQAVEFDGGPSWTRQNVLDLAALGTEGDDSLYGSLGAEAFDGGGGDDLAVGGGGDDTYAFDLNYGKLTIDNRADAGGSHGVLEFGAGISAQDIWLTAVGDDLLINRIGSDDKILVADWFDAGANASLDALELTGGDRLDSQVASLVAAMATFASENTAFNPAIAAAMPSDPTLQSALAASWHS